MMSVRMPPPHSTIVLLHGFTQTGRSWQPLLAAWEEGTEDRARDVGESQLAGTGGQRIAALAPDLRGHGDAADVRPVTFDAVRADVLALTPGPITLVGYSMGGRIALDIALHAPERVERLILIGASPGLADPAERAARCAADTALAEEIERDGIEAFAQRWAALPLFAGQPADVAAAVHAERLRQTPAGLAAALRGLGTGAMEPLWDRLAELTMPVTLIVGECDAKFRAIAERMAAAIPHARLEVVSGAGHAPHLEAPAAVAALLR